MIKKIIIEYMKFNFQREMFKHLSKLKIIIKVIMIIGWSILFIMMKITVNIESHKIKKMSLIILFINFSKNSFKILILMINEIIFFEALII